MELIILGCSGSYGGPYAGACSGYLVREGSTTIWIDCGNGTFGHLQEHVAVEDLTALVITHAHPDHCVDLYGLHVMSRYALHRVGLPVYAPAGLEKHLGTLVDGDWGGTFSWHDIDPTQPVTVGSTSLQFARTDHPPPTYAVEITGGGSRLIYTSDTGPRWSVAAFAPGADLVLSEATYLHDSKSAPIHLSAKEAGAAARAADAHRLMLTHVWPQLDPALIAAEGSGAYGAPVILAEPGLVTAV